MKYLKVTNNGICYPEAFTVLGVSTARNNTASIGMFGSGSKMGMNLLLRKGIPPIVKSKDLTVEFATIEKSMGERKFQQVIAEINGEIKELGFSTEFGELDWTDTAMAIREFVSNALDQGGCQLSVVDSITDETDKTSVYIPYTPEVQEYHENINTYFLQLAGEDFVIGDNPEKGLKVYRKGVAVHIDRNAEALFRYNLNNLKLDESRNADSWTLKYHAALKIHEISENQAKKLVRAFINQEECFETNSLDYSYARLNGLGPIIAKAFQDIYGDAVICPSNMIEHCSKKYRNIIPVNSATFKLFSESGVKVAETKGGKLGVENGYMPIPITTDCKRIVNRVWKKLEKLGLTNGKVKPKIEMFAKPMDCGSQIGGYQEGDIIYIERNYVNSKVILEELGHYITGADDCTRDFQDWSFAVAAATI